ncbi:MAG: response regulator transcription factor [Gemmatimonadota bacterium]|nr:response regulator transcription factor [Gemmatimonadota bacterium]
MRILIAEDDATSRTVLQRTLEKLGYAVTAAHDGFEALALFVRDQPAVVITDWMMPRMDGLELCRRIRTNICHDRYTYLIVLTVLGGKRNYLDAMDAGTDDFITKPFDPAELVTRLRVAERILGMGATLRYCETLLDCCPSCQRVTRPDGRRATLRQVAAEAVQQRPPAPCPDCQRQAAGRGVSGARATA